MVFALLPVWVASFIAFGRLAFAIFLVSVLSGVLWEWIFTKFSRKKITVQNANTIFITMLLGLFLPPDFPLHLILIGTFFTVIAGRELFGGLGQNIFNPSQVGRAALGILFPAAMLPYGLSYAPIVPPSFWDLFIGYRNVGFLGETSVLAVLIGGVILLWKQSARWEVPASHLLVLFIGSVLIGKNPFYETFSGAAFLGAFFLVTDFASSPVTKKGKVVFAAMTAIFTLMMRRWFTYAEGIAFSVLLANAAVPLIDWLIRPGKNK